MNAPPPTTPILSLRGIGKSYRLRGGLLARLRGRTPRLDALRDIDLEIRRGDIVGIVGESGSGKSTLGRIVVRLLEPTEGVLSFEGTALSEGTSRSLRAYRRRVQMIFQDSGSSLNPRKRIRRTLHEALRAAGVPRGRCNEEIAQLLRRTGLPEGILDRHPHALSGGQRQRVNIARALAMQPELLVADEPVSALDVSLQGQIINLLIGLAAESGLTLIFISHDLAVVRRICNRVIVMQSGVIVESGTPSEVMENPQHPYTRKLLDAVPKGLRESA
ncbi:peptide/nickel transport system ATP-binding protein [Faunimonas pinastri]|uniref:Peptide/nickel transport system ATP-binding protein n=1 Tax=Faunimonas pinastri TaxID=1855383 RepID=A0A1H9B671_9HYPH|nr:ATP-binding cassette domain-containing protein [Faunimonas pinastri]SEP84183.1 peptide/nickel transport system ATP-binding protein [Faunimonas pinastri]